MKQLLFSVGMKDLEMQTFRSGGAGGQNQNKRDTGVRLIHKESGAVGESRDTRSQHQNKVLAFKRLCNSDKFQTWVKVEAAKRTGMLDEAKRKVDEMMKPHNIRIEIMESGKWVDKTQQM